MSATAIADFLSSPLSGDKNLKKCFGDDFQLLDSWQRFINQGLRNWISVTNLMSYCGGQSWSVKTFQALYVACWVHNPIEKGTFMIQIPNRCDVNVQTAIKKHCHWRIGSSHLSGKGYSARDNWNFLRHYHELLVQFEKTGNQYFLFLKAEGHTTRPGGVLSHLSSWNNKKKHGEGNMVSPELNALASSAQHRGLVTSRAAENYGKGYEALLKLLGLTGKKVLVHEMLDKLYNVTGFCSQTFVSVTYTSFELGESLEHFLRVENTIWGKLTEEMRKDLRAIATTLKKDPPDILTPRVYQEIRITPDELTSTINEFLAYKPVGLLY